MDLWQAIEHAARGANVPVEYLLAIAQLESNMGQNVRNPNSSAGGPFQFTDATAARYGLTGDLRFDPVMSSVAAAQMTAENMAALARTLGRQPTLGEVYLAHQQGLGGASALLRSPSSNVLDVMTRVYNGDREKARRVIVQNGGNVNMSAAEFAGHWINKAENVQVPTARPTTAAPARPAVTVPMPTPATQSATPPLPRQPATVAAVMPTPVSQRPVSTPATTAAPATARSNMLPAEEISNAFVGGLMDTISKIANAIVPPAQAAAPAPVAAAPAAVAAAPPGDGLITLSASANSTPASSHSARDQRAEQLAMRQRQQQQSALLPLISPTTKEQVESATGFRLPNVAGPNNVQKDQSRLLPTIPQPAPAPVRTTTNPEYTRLMERVRAGELELKGMTPASGAVSRDYRARYDATAAALKALQEALAATPKTITVPAQGSGGSSGGSGSSYVPPTTFQGTSSGKTYTAGQKYQMGGDTYTANADGSFTNDRTGRTQGTGSLYYDTDSNTFKTR